MKTCIATVLMLCTTLRLDSSFASSHDQQDGLDRIQEKDSSTISVEIRKEGEVLDLEKEVLEKPLASKVVISNDFMRYEDPFCFSDIWPSLKLSKLKELYLSNADFIMEDQEKLMALLRKLEKFQYKNRECSYTETLLFCNLFEKAEQNEFKFLVELTISPLDFSGLEDPKSMQENLILGILRTCPKLRKVTIDGLDKKIQEELQTEIAERLKEVAY